MGPQSPSESPGIWRVDLNCHINEQLKGVSKLGPDTGSRAAGSSGQGGFLWRHSWAVAGLPLTGQGKNLLCRNGLRQPHSAYLKDLCSSSAFLENTAEVWLCDIEIRCRKLAKLRGCAKQSQKNCQTANWRESESDWAVCYQNSKIQTCLSF